MYLGIGVQTHARTALDGATSVIFNGTPALSYSVLSGTSISAKVPDGATAAGSFTTPCGRATSSGAYTVTLSITGSLPAAGRAGTRVTISGVGFNRTSTETPIARLNGTEMTKVRVSGGRTRIAATVPAGAKRGKISVQNKAAPVGTFTSAGTFTKR